MPSAGEWHWSWSGRRDDEMTAWHFATVSEAARVFEQLPANMRAAANVKQYMDPAPGYRHADYVPVWGPGAETRVVPPPPAEKKSLAPDDGEGKMGSMNTTADLRKLAVMAIHAMRDERNTTTPKAKAIAAARFDGIASVASDVLALTMTPFGFRLAVGSTLEAMPEFPARSVTANSPNGRGAWVDNATDVLLAILADAL